MPRKKKTKRTTKKKFPEQEVRAILEKVYLAGWKHNKLHPAGFPNQMSVEQALEAIKSL